MAGKLGERPLLIFSTLWRAFLMTFLTAFPDRNGKLSEGLRQVYAKKRKKSLWESTLMLDSDANKSKAMTKRRERGETWCSEGSCLSLSFI